MRITTSTSIAMALPQLTEAKPINSGWQVSLDTGFNHVAYVSAAEADQLSEAWADIAIAIRNQEVIAEIAKPNGAAA